MGGKTGNLSKYQEGHENWDLETWWTRDWGEMRNWRQWESMIIVMRASAWKVKSE